MNFTILTLFPEFFNSFDQWSIIGRAVENNIVSIESVNIRDFSENKHKKVDDYTYGGGPGMVMTPQPLYDSINSVRQENSKVIYLSPQGSILTQKKLLDLSKEKHLILLCGHYEGIDNRIVENYVDEEISIGDYVLTGGEIPAMVLVDGITRLLPGVLSRNISFEEESHFSNFLEYPQYTRPESFNGYDVPDILLSGHHKNIEYYRKVEAIKNTLIKRPDLLKNMVLSDEDNKIIEELKKSIDD